MTGYPLLDVFLSMLWFFLLILWFFLLFRILTDIFRDDQLSGWGKAGWTIFLIFLPLLGALVYLIVRGRSMGERDAQIAKANETAFKQYVQQAAGTSTGSAEELSKLADLHKSGVLTDEEFAAQKAKLLG